MSKQSEQKFQSEAINPEELAKALDAGAAGLEEAIIEEIDNSSVLKSKRGRKRQRKVKVLPKGGAKEANKKPSEKKRVIRSKQRQLQVEKQEADKKALLEQAKKQRKANRWVEFYKRERLKRKYAKLSSKEKMSVISKVYRRLQQKKLEKINKQLKK